MGPASTKLISVYFAYALMIPFLTVERVRTLNGIQILGFDTINGRF